MIKKGFGKSEPPTRGAKEFMRGYMDCAVTAQGDEAKIDQFLKSNRAKLDESLLDALPLVFDSLIANQGLKERENIANHFGNFGNIIKQFPLGNRMLNLELSISAYSLALTIFEKEASLYMWATTQNNLGNAYAVRIQGECSENLEKAIIFYESALQIRTRDAFPEEWAMTQSNLGNVYHNRIKGERSENLEKAITFHELALQVYTRDTFPKKWADIQHNIGNAYRDRIRGERAENLEKAIKACELALQVYTQEAFLENWANTQNSLGAVYGDRIRGERSENLDKAITAYELALLVYTREAFPEQWAMTQNNLGAIYGARIRGKRLENLEKAMKACELALQVYTQQAFPQDWARAQGNAARVFIQRASITDNALDLDAAIALLQHSLKISSPHSPNFIDNQYALGNALSRHYEYSQNPTDLQQSLQAYKIALEAISPEHYDRKDFWQAIPTTQSILGSRLVRDGQWQEGLQLLLNSVSQLSTGGDPLAHANALFQTGRAHEFLADWDNARLYYRDALRLYEYLQNESGIAKSSTGLGGVLVTQGHLEKGISELAKAQQSYHQLEQLEKAAEVASLRQTAQKVMESQMIEAYL